MKQTPISARIDTEVLQYCKSNGGKLNTLINELLAGWKKGNEEKQILMFKTETGTDELSQMASKDNFKCSQCCNNCKHLGYKNQYVYQCNYPQLNITIYINKIRQFCCIYWERNKKGA